MADMVICGASRGRYGYPWRIDGPRGIKEWRSESGRKLPRPSLFRCDQPEHRTYAGRVGRAFSRANGYVQRWVLTKREFKAAVEAWDMFSLEMPPRFLCSDCAHKERRLAHAHA